MTNDDNTDKTPAPPKVEAKDQPLLIYWSNLLSFRFWIACFIAAAILAFLTGLVLPNKVAGILFWVYIALAVLVGLITGDALDCPKCGKNVKMGKTRCHHCGYDIPSHNPA